MLFGMGGCFSGYGTFQKYKNQTNFNFNKNCINPGSKPHV